MGKLNCLVKAIERYALIFMLLCMVVLAMLQIISRFVIQSPIPWTEAMLTYLFVWTCFLGSSYAVAEKSHFSVEILVMKCTPRIQKVLALVVNLVIFAMALIMIKKGMMFVLANHDQLMAAMPFSMSWPYLAIPVSGAFICIHVFDDAVNNLKGGR